MDQEPPSQEPAAHDPSPHDSEEEQDRITSIHAVKSFLLALGILVLGSVLLITLVLTKKEPEKKETKELVTSVRVQAIVPGEHRVRIETQGVVSSLHEVTLAAEVGGRVINKVAALVVGAEVSKGEVLLEIEAADYQAALARAESARADAKLALEQEEAMAEQAAIDWQKLGRGEPTDLVLRKPQCEAATARLASAEAEVLRARRDLERTRIRAPFDARVRSVQAELGAVLAPGSPVAQLYSAKDLEVRLPFTLLDYGFLRQGDATELVLSATIGGERRSWPAVLDRIDGEVQRSTLSAYGMARIQPNGAGELPPVGLFVEAEVPGQLLEEVVVLPRSAVRGSNEVWLARDGKLARCQLTILRAGATHLVARADFEPGDQLVLTRLAAPMTGMKVETIEQGQDSP